MNKNKFNIPSFPEGPVEQWFSTFIVYTYCKGTHRIISRAVTIEQIVS